MSNKISLNKNTKLIFRALSDIVLKRTPSLGSQIISVSTIKLSPDLKDAQIYISTLASNKKEILSKLNELQPTIKKDLTLAIGKQIRKIPSLTFKIDDKVDEMIGINSILDKI
jgi:ribosome-binding factor A